MKALLAPLAALGALLMPGSLPAQDEPWLAEVPTARHVIAELQPGASRINAVRTSAALFSLQNLAQSLLGGRPASAAAMARVAAYMPTRDSLANIEYAKDRETYRFERCNAWFDQSPEFHRELLDRFFSQAWLATHGARLDPRRWRAPLALPAGTRVGGPYPDDCGGGAVAAGPAPAAARAGAPATDAARAAGEQLVKAGDAAFAAADTTAALQLYERAIAADPRSVMGHFGVARILEYRGQHALALESWKRAAALAPSHPVFMGRVGLSLYKQGRFEAAVDPLRASTGVTPPAEWTAPLYVLLGKTHLALRRRDDAIATWRALAALDTAQARILGEAIAAAGGDAAPSAGAPASSAALVAEGEDALKGRRYADARNAFEAAARVDPTNPRIFLLLGKSQIEDTTLVDYFELADSSFRRALALNPADPELLVELGEMRYWTAPLEAEAPFRAALDLNPPPKLAARAHLGIGNVLMFFEANGSAVNELQTATQLDPSNEEALYTMGVALAKYKALAEARRIHRQLLTINRRLATALLATITEEGKKP